MKKQAKVVKGALLAVAVLFGGFVQAEDDGCGSCTAAKVIEKAREQGVVEIKSLTYSLGNWKVEGTNGENIDIEAKIHCPQEANSKASVIKVGKASRTSISKIAQKVKKLTTGKIQKIEYNGYRWEVIAIEGMVELEYHFDKDGALTGQLITD